MSQLKQMSPEPETVFKKVENDFNDMNYTVIPI